MAGITNSVYTKGNQNVSNIPRKHRESDYHSATPCNQNEVACNVPTNDLTVGKHVCLPVNGACTSESSYDDNNESDSYATLKNNQAKPDELNGIGTGYSFDSNMQELTIFFVRHIYLSCRYNYKLTSNDLTITKRACILLYITVFNVYFNPKFEKSIIFSSFFFKSILSKLIIAIVIPKLLCEVQLNNVPPC